MKEILNCEKCMCVESELGLLLCQLLHNNPTIIRREKGEPFPNWCPLLALQSAEPKEQIEGFGEAEIEAHWEWIGGLFDALESDSDRKLVDIGIETCRYLYTTAMTHGYKHAKDE